MSKEYIVALPAADVQLIINALSELPIKVALRTLNNLERQCIAQDEKVAEISERELARAAANALPAREAEEE